MLIFLTNNFLLALGYQYR